MPKFKVGDKVTVSGPSYYNSYRYCDGKPYYVSELRSDPRWTYTISEELDGTGNYHSEDQLTLWVDPMLKVAAAYQFDAGIQFRDGKLILSPVSPEHLEATLDCLKVPKKRDAVANTLLNLSGWVPYHKILKHPKGELRQNSDGVWTFGNLLIQSIEEANALHTLLKGQT